MRIPSVGLLIAVAVSAACHSSGSQTPPGSGGTGGAAGAGGAAGSGASGSGGASGGGGARDGGQALDGGGGVTGMTAAEVCRAAVQVQCDRVIACEGLMAATDCLRYANPCPDYYFNADSNRTVAGMAACLDALAARTCTDIVLGLFPSCFVNGKRPTNSGCAYPSQCASGRCGGGEVCQTCGVGPALLGTPCSGAPCQSGTFCHPTTSLCTDGTTVVHAHQGEACDLAATPVVGCVGDLICVRASPTGSAGSCTPPPGAGQPCASAGFSDSICAVGNVCSSGSSGTCAGLGACGAGVTCDDASYCKTSAAGMACAPAAIAGQPCGDPNTTSLAPCAAPFYCLGSPSACARVGAAGDACSADHPCGSLLMCIAGTCTPLGSANCPADGGTP